MLFYDDVVIVVVVVVVVSACGAPKDTLLLVDLPSGVSRDCHLL